MKKCSSKEVYAREARAKIFAKIALVKMADASDLKRIIVKALVQKQTPILVGLPHKSQLNWSE